MDDKELKAYRLTSMEEPTDEMILAIMEKVAEVARKSTKERFRYAESRGNACIHYAEARKRLLRRNEH